MLEIGRGEIRGYGANIVTGTATKLKRTQHGGFTVALDEGAEIVSRRILVSTGLVDVLPDIPGLADRWGRDVVHCPFCFGWELRDARLGAPHRTGTRKHD